MEKGLYVAVSGATTQSAALDVIANNVANVNTTGFKAERISFSQALAQAGDEAPQAAVRTVVPDPTPGALRRTENPLDLALANKGYFALATPGGVRYSRAGSFHVGTNDSLVNAHNQALLDRDGSVIQVPPGAKTVTVDTDGGVMADGVEVGKIGVISLDALDLRREGDVFAARPGAMPEVVDTPEVVSGALESSNFDAVHGVVELVRVSRTFESLMRMIEGYKQVDERTAREVGKSR